MAIVQRIAELLLRYRTGDLTEAERRDLYNWVDENKDNESLFDQLTAGGNLREALAELYTANISIKQKIDAAISEEKVIGMPRTRKWAYVAAASVMLLLTCGT